MTPPEGAGVTKAPSAASCGQESRRALNEGWLHVERSTLDQLDAYATETTMDFAGGWLEIRRYSWSRPVESVWATDRRCYLLNLSLVGASEGGRAHAASARSRDPETLGRMFLVPPGETVRCSSERGRVRSMRCALDADMVESMTGPGAGPGCDRTRLPALLDLQGCEIEWLLRRMYREAREPDPATPTMVEAIARQLSGEIVRKLRSDVDARFRIGGLAPWRMRLIGDRLRADLPTPDLEELARLCDMTVRHLARGFRTETGVTLGRHVEAAMVERAGRMLRSGATVRQVAERLGYATPGGFTAAFRRATGLLPSEIRNGTSERRTSEPTLN